MSKLLTWMRVAFCLTLMGSVMLAGAQAAAGSAQKYDVEIKRGVVDKTNPNLVTLLATVRNADTNTIPSENVLKGLSVNAFGQPAGGGGQTDISGCVRLTSIENAKRGVHECAIYVSKGGAWKFTVAVNTVASEHAVELGKAGASLNRVGGGTATLEVDAPKLEGFNRERASIEANPRDVVILLAHVIGVIAWSLCAGLLAAIALPPLRRLLSNSAATVLEVRCRTLITFLWVSFLVVLSTGAIMMGQMLPYELPTSWDDASATFALPFGQAYFGALAVKLLTFAVMVAATVVISLAANKRARIPSELEDADAEGEILYDDADPWHASAGNHSGTATASAVVTRKQTREQLLRQLDTAPAMVATMVFAVGLAIVGFCVTLLKYLHELIEAVKAYL